MVRSLLYVGRTKGNVSFDQLDISAATRDCRTRLKEILGITGALLVCDRFVAHVVEGEPEALAEIRAEHQPSCAEADLQLILDEELSERRFSDWSLAYAGGTAYVAERLRPLVEGSNLTDSARLVKAQQVLQMMHLFAGS